MYESRAEQYILVLVFLHMYNCYWRREWKEKYTHLPKLNLYNTNAYSARKCLNFDYGMCPKINIAFAVIEVCPVTVKGQFYVI